MRALLALVLLTAPAYADSITTKDGARHEGRILDRLETGYLFRTSDGKTSIIDFKLVDDLQRGDAPLALPPPPPPPMLVPNRQAEILGWQLGLLEGEKERFFSLPMPLVQTGAGLTMFILGSLLLTNRATLDIGADFWAAGGSLFIEGTIVTCIRLYERRVIDGRIEALHQEALRLGVALPRE